MMRHPFFLLLCLIAPCAEAQVFSCSLSVPTVNFGNYTGSQVTPGATTLTIACPLLAAYTVGLNAGTGAGATTTTRKMTGPGSATLNYQIFQNSSHTINWGNTVGTDTVSGTGDILNQSISMYPQLAGGQYTAPGTYTDTITASAKSSYGTQTTTFTVTATVVANCQISASELNMGNYAGVTLNATSTVTVTCTNTTTFNIGLNAGTSAGATVTTRKMTGTGSATLNYSLFRDSGYSQNWGSTVGTDTLGSSGTGGAQNFVVYGQIPAGQFVAPGTYNDTIIATITY